MSQFDQFNQLLTSYPWLELALKIAVAALVGYVVHGVTHRIVQRFARRYVVFDRIMRFTKRPAQALIILLFVHLSLADATRPAAILGLLRQALSILIILLVTAFIIRLIAALVDVVAYRHPIEGPDNLRARSVQTKVQVLARTAMFIVGVLGVGSVLMTFPNVRQIGASLLASAGLAGIIAGLAARPVLGNLIAGLQIALTQPLRIDDVLIVENEWGRVEEITETYVVIRVWDERRLIVPLEYFIQTPFQNWTRNSSQLLGSVFLWVDFGTPIEPLRVKAKAIVESAPEWDGRVCNLQVTDVSERTMQLRILVSASDAGKTFDLRCKVREQMIAFLQQEYPDKLPQVRTSVIGLPDSNKGGTGDQPVPSGAPSIGTTAGIVAAPAQDNIDKGNA